MKSVFLRQEKQKSGAALSRSWVRIRIFSHRSFAWNIRLQKHFFWFRPQMSFSLDLGTVLSSEFRKKRKSGAALAQSWVGIRIFSHRSFAWNIPLQKHFSRICDQGNILGDPDRFGRKIFVTGLQDVQDLLLSTPQSVVILSQICKYSIIDLKPTDSKRYWSWIPWWVQFPWFEFKSTFRLISDTDKSRLKGKHKNSSGWNITLGTCKSLECRNTMRKS